MVFGPKHQGALDSLPFQGFTRCSGIQVFRLYSRPSPGMDRNGRAGLGCGGGWRHRENVYAVCRGYVVVLALRELVAWEFSVRRPRGGPSVILLSRVHMSVDALYFLLSWNDEVHAVLCTPRTRTRKPTHAHTHTHAYAHLQLVQADRPCQGGHCPCRLCPVRNV